MPAKPTPNGASINGIYPLNDVGEMGASALPYPAGRQAKLSFEVFPAKTAAGQEALLCELEGLAAYNPEFISVTYGAGGSSRDGTAATAKAIQNRYQTEVMAHITYSAQSRADVMASLERFKDIGIRQILALRGDEIVNAAKTGGSATANRQAFANSVEFITAVKEMGFDVIRTTAYPDVHKDAKDADADFDWLLAKFDAGASEAITQFFFDADHFLKLRDRLDKFGFADRLIPGILAFQDAQKMQNFARQCGVYIPPALQKELDKTANSDLAEAHALSVLLDLWLRLNAEGVSRYHVYTLNKARPTQTLLELLGVRKQASCQLSAQPVLAKKHPPSDFPKGEKGLNFSKMSYL